jgi:putative transposase
MKVEEGMTGLAPLWFSSSMLMLFLRMIVSEGERVKLHPPYKGKRSRTFCQDRKAVAADLKSVYGVKTEAEAEQALMSFAERWDRQYPTISKSWMQHWERVRPLFAFPTDIRKAIYTTNAIESVCPAGAKRVRQAQPTSSCTCAENMTLRKVLRNHRSFPIDESAMKVIYLAIHNISKKWTMPIRDWKSALNRLG